MLEWIDFDKQKPESGQEVVVKCRNSNGSVCKVVAVWLMERWWIGSNGIELDAIHWFPLPEEP